MQIVADQLIEEYSLIEVKFVCSAHAIYQNTNMDNKY